MNRKRIRAIGADTIPRITISLKNIAPTVGAERPAHSSETYIGGNDDNILAEAIRGTLAQLGINRVDLAAAMLFNAINSMFPPPRDTDFRRLIAWGIVTGASYNIEQTPTEEEGVMELSIAAFPAYPPLQTAQGQEAPQGKIWTPGDPV